MQRITVEALTSGTAQWHNLGGFKYEQLAESIQQFIVLRNFTPGTMLPPERELASALQVGRGTVVRAYELLAKDLVLVRERGSGTRIAGNVLSEVKIQAHLWEGAESLLKHTGPSFYLAMGSPYLDDALSELSVDFSDLFRYQVPLHGYVPYGLDDLREAIAARLSSARIEVEKAQVLITTGAHPALALICELLLDSKKHMLVETPSYSAALELANHAGSQAVSLVCDHDGPILADLEQALSQHNAGFVYLMPTVHHPTGRIMSLERRKGILAICQAADVVLVEDMALSEIRYSGNPPPPSFFELSQGQGVISLGSFSKSVWGGLRVGWAISDKDSILKLSRQKLNHELGSGILEQVAVLKLLPRLDGLITIRRQFAEQNYAVIAEFLQSELPAWSFSPPRGGNSVWVELPAGNGDDFVVAAAECGVIIEAGSDYALNGRYDRYIRLASGPPIEDLKAALQQLKTAWLKYSQSLSLETGDEF